MSTNFLCVTHQEKLNRSLRNFYAHAASTTTIDNSRRFVRRSSIAHSLLAQTSVKSVAETIVRR
jgi:hypothetical protein